MIDERKLIEAMWDKYNSFYNSAIRFEEEETEMAFRVLSDIQNMIEKQSKIGTYDLCKKEYIDIMEFLDIFYGTNLIATVLKDYEKLQRDFDIAYKLYDELREKFVSLCDESDKYEKALDKACEKLEELEYCYCLFDHDYAESNLYHKGRRCSNKDEWREVLMKND